MATAEPIYPDFSIADAEHPSISYDSGDVTLTFLDWREQSVCVVFHHVVRFQWTDDWDDPIEGELYDGTTLIKQSDWVPKHLRIPAKHYRLNFNACGGRLDIACKSFEVMAQR